MKTILVAEDRDDDVFLLKRALARTRIPAQVHIVPNGEEALAYLRGERQYSDRERFAFPTLALLDIHMPRKTWLEVLEEIRRDPRLTRLAVVFLTSSDDVRDINRAYELHANSYLVKTGDQQVLQTLVSTIDEYWLK